MKTMILLSVFLALWCFYLNCRIDLFKKENISLQGEKNALSEIIKGYENAKVESDRTIKKLRAATENNKENLDWYNQRVPYDVLDIMQKQYSNRKAD